jgi:hypothetical protein
MLICALMADFGIRRSMYSRMIRRSWLGVILLIFAAYQFFDAMYIAYNAFWRAGDTIVPDS